MSRAWFEDNNFTKLELVKFKSISNHEVECSASISDLKVIEHFVSRIERIPANGDMMKSFGGNTEHIKLIFFREDGKKEEIDIYQKRFKTPSTGFNSSDGEVEKTLYGDIDALLFPALDKNILKVENLELDFKHFTIEYTGSEFRDAAPVSLSFMIDKFIVKDKREESKRIEISSGQLPPQPFTVKMNERNFILLTYKTKDSKRLYPNYFQIIKAN